jgi:molybdenum cofactor biosynthesis enzyme MoaA
VAPCYACKLEASLKQASLEEIWRGEAFESLRKKFKEGVIPDECSFCRGHLKNGNFASILANKYDHHSAPNKGYPAIVEFELGNQCNLECVMCCGELSSSIRAHREKKDPVESIVDADFAKHFDFCLPHLRAAEFTGGDPFLIPAYDDIWSTLKRVNPKIDILITTNANTMTEKVEKLLASNLRLSFNISIDSLDQAVYEKIRVNADFENVMRNISRFAAYTQSAHTSLGFLVCPMQPNAFELQEFVPFAQKHSASVSYHVVFKPSHLALWTLRSDELNLLHRHLEKFTFKGSDFITRLNARNYQGLVDLIGVWAEKARIREEVSLQRDHEIATLIQEKESLFWNKLASVVEEEDLSHHRARIKALIARMDVPSLPELVYVRLAEIVPEDIVSALNTMNDDALMLKLDQYHNSVYYEWFAGVGLSDNDKYELSMKGLKW